MLIFISDVVVVFMFERIYSLLIRVFYVILLTCVSKNFEDTCILYVFYYTVSTLVWIKSKVLYVCSCKILSQRFI